MIETRLTGDRQQAALDEFLFVGGQNEAGARLDALAQEGVVERRHDRAPENIFPVNGA